MTSYEELKGLVRRAARSVEIQWPGVIDRDDVEQEIWLRLAESKGSVNKLLGMADDARYRAVVGMGHQIASRERASLDYFRGAYNYSVGEVKDLLRQGILVERQSNFRAELLDMEDALVGMNETVPQYAEAIVSRYLLEKMPSCKSEKNALSRGLERLADEMNKVAKRRHSERDDGPGTRQAMSNQAMNDYSRREYSGGDIDHDDEFDSSHHWETGGGWR